MAEITKRKMRQKPNKAKQKPKRDMVGYFKRTTNWNCKYDTEKNKIKCDLNADAKEKWNKLTDAEQARVIKKLQSKALFNKK